jgi:hypothetical protein
MVGLPIVESINIQYRILPDAWTLHQPMASVGAMIQLETLKRRFLGQSAMGQPIDWLALRTFRREFARPSGFGFTRAENGGCCSGGIPAPGRRSMSGLMVTY